MPKKPVDLKAVREARERLQQLAAAHPELIGLPGPDNRAGWEATLKENEMSPTKMTGFRLPEELLARIDAYAEHLAALAGVPVSRAAAVVKLLGEALERAEAETKKSRKK